MRPAGRWHLPLSVLAAGYESVRTCLQFGDLSKPGAKFDSRPAKSLDHVQRLLAGTRGSARDRATFKELEVYGVLSRIPAGSFRALVVASAGNTAAAFARACSENDVPCLIVVPECGMKKMLFASPLKPCVKVICLTGHASYADAISFAEKVAQQDGFVSEGGVKNVAAVTAWPRPC